jgi:catechol 2,3-dioxygenase-like lactoylglutathione lyase family enzyme
MSMIPFSLRKLDHIVLRVADLKKSLHFYLDVLGCTMDKEQPQIGLYQVRAGQSLIDLVPLDQPLGRMGGAGPSREGRNLDHFAIQIAPFDDATIRAHLAQHGVEVAEAGRRYGAEGNGPSVYIRDPDGNTVELKGPAEP